MRARLDRGGVNDSLFPPLATALALTLIKMTLKYCSNNL